MQTQWHESHESLTFWLIQCEIKQRSNTHAPLYRQGSCPNYSLCAFVSAPSCVIICKPAYAILIWLLGGLESICTHLQSSSTFSNHLLRLRGTRARSSDRSFTVTNMMSQRADGRSRICINARCVFAAGLGEIHNLRIDYLLIRESGNESNRSCPTGCRIGIWMEMAARGCY